MADFNINYFTKKALELYSNRYNDFETMRNEYMVTEAYGFLECLKIFDVNNTPKLDELQSNLIDIFTLLSVKNDAHPATDNGITVNPLSEWQEYKDFETFTVEDFMTIVDDATANGFEFKIENGKVYYREIDVNEI